LPKALVDEEILRVKEQIRDAGDTDLASIEQGKTFEEQARRRVALGLIIAEVVKKNQFKAAPDKVRAAVDAVAVTYEHPEEVVKWYYARRERLGNVEALVLEDQAVEWLVQQAKVNEKPAAFHDLIHGFREKV
jgi:trigger factor